MSYAMYSSKRPADLAFSHTLTKGRDGQKHLKKILAPQPNKSTSPLMHVWNTALFHKPNRYIQPASLFTAFFCCNTTTILSTYTYSYRHVCINTHTCTHV